MYVLFNMYVVCFKLLILYLITLPNPKTGNFTLMFSLKSFKF